jgi:hypothetical protein
MPEDQEQVYHQEETPTRYVVFLTYEAILSWGQVVTETTDELIVRLGYKIGKNHGIYKKPDKNRSITNGQVIGSYASVDDAYTSYQGLIDLDETSPLSEKALGAYLSERVEGFRNQIVVDTARRIRSGSFSLTDDGLEPSYQEEEVVEPPFLLQHISDKMPVPNWLVILSGGAWRGLCLLGQRIAMGGNGQEPAAQGRRLLTSGARDRHALSEPRRLLVT